MQRRDFHKLVAMVGLAPGLTVGSRVLRAPKKAPRVSWETQPCEATLTTPCGGHCRWHMDYTVGFGGLQREPGRPLRFWLRFGNPQFSRHSLERYRDVQHESSMTLYRGSGSLLFPHPMLIGMTPMVGQQLVTEVTAVEPTHLWCEFWVWPQQYTAEAWDWGN